MADDSLKGLSTEQIRRAEELRDAMSDTARSVSRFNRELANSELGTANVSSYFGDISRSASKVASIQEEIRKSSVGTEKALSEQVKNAGKVRILNEKINELYTRAARETGRAKDLLLDQARALESGRDNAQELSKIYGEIVESSQEIDKQSRFFDGIAQVVKDIPGLRKLSTPFQDAAKAAREASIQNLKIKDTNSRINELGAEALNTGRGLTKEKLKELGLTEIVGNKSGTAAASILKKYQASNKAVNVMGVGFKAVGKSLTKAFAPLALLQLAVDTIKFIVSLFKAANEQTIAIARNMSITKDSAREVRDTFIGISQASKETYITTSNLIKAQQELTQELGRAGTVSDETLKAQTFLTERMKMSAGEAAKIAARSQAFGENAEKSLETILAENAERTKTGESLLTQSQLLTQISKVSGQIAAYFGFSNVEIAKGIAKVSRFGLNLQQARNISEGLLNFESSISNELEAELLTGRQLNLERARMKALTGDIAGATEEVMQQMKGLTAQQRRSPIIMKSLAATIGLSVDELQDAYLLETDRTRQAKELERIYREQGATEAENYRRKMGLEQALMKDVKETVTLEEQYKEAVSKVKDLFAGLVSDGIVDILADSIRALAEWISKLPGMQGRAAERRAKKLEESGVINKDLADNLAMQAKGARWWEYAGITGGLALYKDMRATQAQAMISQLEKASVKQQTGEPQLASGGIVTQPTRALVGEAGSEAVIPLREFYAKMDEMIQATKSGMIVNLDGRKVNQGLYMASSKLDRYQ